MVIYEVNLQISVAIFDAYFEWLQQHVAEMRTLSGFKKVSILKELRTHEDEIVKITVQYLVESLSELDDYLNNNAQGIREESFNKFPNGFSLMKRIFKIIE